jgi:hypothetical protein
LVDYLLPELTAYEVAMYLVILRETILGSGERSLRIGKRTLSAKFAKGARTTHKDMSRAPVTEL